MTTKTPTSFRSFLTTLTFLFCLLLSACGAGYKAGDPCYTPAGCQGADTATEQDDTGGTLPDPIIDEDGDGYTGEEDCDDTNPAVHSGAEEIPYNGINEDCDESTPDDDLDGDDYVQADDCDDADPTSYPGADEVPDNGIDEDCDGEDEVTDPGNFEESELCWDSVPFDIQFLNVDRSVVETVSGDWSGLDWLDYDPIFVVDASADSTEVTVYAPGGCGSAVEGQVYLPNGFVMREESDPLYNNGIVVAFQPDGSVAEINYLEPCGDGSYSGWVLPDAGFQDACASGYSSSVWLGAHGGSHASGSQAVRIGELTSDSPIGRPLPIEVDNNHLSCPEGASSGHDCFVGPLAASGDAYALDEYSGTIPELTMGSALILPDSFDCYALTTRPGQRLCEVAQDHFFYIVDDSYGDEEVAFPIEEGVAEEVEASEGIQMHNATGDYKADLEAIMGAILVVANPETAIR